VGRVSTTQFYPAGRVCPNCGDPLSVFFDDERCRQCFHRYKIEVLHPLERKSIATKAALEILSQVPKYNG
jgi:hypothetical protein